MAIMFKAKACLVVTGMLLGSLFSSYAFADVIDSEVINFEVAVGWKPGYLGYGYGGLVWNGMTSEMPSWSIPSKWTYPNYQPGDYGDLNGVVSGDDVAFMKTGSSISNPNGFTLNGGYFTAEYDTGLNVRADAVGLDGQTYTKTFVIDYTAPSQIIFGWSGITNVTFTSFGGTPNQFASPYPGFQNKFFVVDDLSVSNVAQLPTPPIPEPKTYMMMLGGLGLLGFAGRRKKQI
jgi:hypothetical protein